MNFHYDEHERRYTGSELRPHFILENFRLRGSSLVAFEGGCDVDTMELVDWEDRLDKSHIRAGRMLHFMGEFFQMGLREACLWQRLFMSVIAENLRNRGIEIVRRGDDLFWQKRKLSVSVATASPVSALLHVGINIDPTGAPVPAVGLNEWDIAARELAGQVLESFSREWDGMSWACAKVRPVI